MEVKFKILLYSHYFYPSVGGIETVSLALAEGFLRNNIECKIITKTPTEGERIFPFEIVRCPGFKRQIELIKWADVVLFNGVSLALQPWIIFYKKPFVWVHAGYQVSCIDGLGWVDGAKAPLKPFSSLLYHMRLKGLGSTIKDGGKLYLKRFVAKYLVSKNIAITDWIKNVQPLPRQVRIYNPFPVKQFQASSNAVAEYDFMFLGRIVSEKGVGTLLKSFALVHQNNPDLKLLIIGDGGWRDKMELLTAELNIDKSVTYVGNKSGMELVNWVSKGKIAIIPSEWFEPMGGVVIELMAAGKNIIVSEYGGLNECLGDAGLNFPNGNHESLALQMIKLITDEDLMRLQRERAIKRIELFNPEIFILEYIDLLKSLAYNPG